MLTQQQTVDSIKKIFRLYFEPDKPQFSEILKDDFKLNLNLKFLSLRPLVPYDK